MFRKIFVLSLTLVLLLAIASPAGAISYGVPDGTAHPNVGSIVVRIGANLYQWCSGTLISPTVLLTASHCTAPIDSIISAYPGAEVLVTFDPAISASGNFYSGGVWHTNPNYYTANGYNDPGDVAVIVFPYPIGGITPASLPAEGLLGQLKADHTLDNTLFTAVGYGTVRNTNHTAW